MFFSSGDFWFLGPAAGPRKNQAQGPPNSDALKHQSRRQSLRSSKTHRTNPSFSCDGLSMGLGGSGRRSLGSSAQPKQVHRTCMKALALGISHRLSFSPHSDTVHKHFPYRKCTPGPKTGGCGGLNGAVSAGSRCWPGRTRGLEGADALRKPHWRRWHQGLARGILCADGLLEGWHQGLARGILCADGLLEGWGCQPVQLDCRVFLWKEGKSMQRMLLAAWGTWGEALARALRPHAKLSDLRVFSNSITDVGLQASSRAAAGRRDLLPASCVSTVKTCFPNI